MTDRTMTALYDTRGAAETARDELINAGLPRDGIVIRGIEGDDATSPATTDTARVTTVAGESRGFWGGLADLFMPDDDRATYEEGLRRGGFLVSVNPPPGLEDEAEAILERSEPVDVDARASSWRESGWAGFQPGDTSEQVVAGTARTAPMPATGATSAGAAVSGTDTGTARSLEGEDTLKVMEEQLRVGKRDVGRGSVRVRSYVTERPVEEQVELRQEHVSIERRPVDRELTAGEATAAFQERTIEAVERGEEAVVSKTARVVEEIGIRKDVEHETETVRDNVRKQEVEVDDDRTAARAGVGRSAVTPVADVPRSVAEPVDPELNPTTR